MNWRASADTVKPFITAFMKASFCISFIACSLCMMRPSPPITVSLTAITPPGIEWPARMATAPAYTASGPALWAVKKAADAVMTAARCQRPPEGASGRIGLDRSGI